MGKPLSRFSKPVTDKQIGRIMSSVRKACEKFSSVSFQQALKRGRLDAKVVTAVEIAIQNAIKEAKEFDVFIVPELNRNWTPQQVLASTKGSHILTGNSDVVTTMPSNGIGMKKNVEVEFFRHEHGANMDDEYRKHGLIPDPYGVAAVNVLCPIFADLHSNNGTYWADYYIIFDYRPGGFFVRVQHRRDGYFNPKWLGGIRKKKAV
ncbi:MAG: hypothetical protein PHT40_04355 [Patescibacteria group bacterium]|nr:hypothetical protein [Patescibacteria group bacterium]